MSLLKVITSHTSDCHCDECVPIERRLIGYRVVRTVVRDGVEVREWLWAGTWGLSPSTTHCGRRVADTIANGAGGRVVEVYLTVRRRRK